MKVSWIDRLRPSRRPMSCEEVGRWLQHHLDGELDGRRTARLVHHLEECRRCGLEYDTYVRIKQSLADRSEPLAPDAVARLRDFGARLARGEHVEHP